MQVHYDEGVATRIGPELCVVGREAGSEASAGEHIGQVLSRERYNQSADAVCQSEGNMVACAIASVRPALRGQRPRACMDAFRPGTGRSLARPQAAWPSGPHREGDEPKPMMHEREKSDPAIVAVKPANTADRPEMARAVVEQVEPRAGAEENATQDGTHRTPSRADVSPGLERVRQTARGLKEKFTALLHHVDTDLLLTAYHALKREAAAGVDEMTWRDYGEDIERRLEDLHGRIHRGAYRAQPSRRTFMPKPDGRARPLGIATLEDKIVQRALVEVLNAIYEEDFLGFSYGFRPGRSQHLALDALAVGIDRTQVNWIVDADIAGFFDTVSHDWLIRFVEHRIGDQRVLRPIRKWLTVGVMEDGVVTPSERGGHAAGRGHLATAGEHLPALRLRSLGAAMAQTPCPRERHPGALCRRHRRRLRAQGRCREVLDGASSTDGRVRVVAASGQDAPDRVWPLRGGKPKAARPWQTGDVQLPGLHAYLRTHAQGILPAPAEVPT